MSAILSIRLSKPMESLEKVTVEIAETEDEFQMAEI